MVTPMSARSLGGTLRTPRVGDTAVPFLPGHVIEDPRKVHHPLAQTLQFKLDGAADSLKPHSFRGTKPAQLSLEQLQVMSHPAYRLDLTGPVLTHEERAAAKDSARNTSRPPDPPAWLKHDRQILRFYTYFQEPVHESPNENFRVRACTLYFFLEDGTIQISEPRVENSGIPQGAFVKRHRVPRPDGTGFYEPKDITCGSNITIYAKTFRVADCDEFTKWFYQNSFLDIGATEEIPTDSFTIAAAKGPSQRGMTRDIAEGKEYTELMLGGNRKNSKLQQYLANDRKVLRFHCYWDDHTRYGTRQYYILHYFLSDDTVEISECYARNCGRDPYPIFWRRSPLKKKPILNPTPAMLEPEPELYKPADLLVGQSVDIFGRKIVIHDCDDFTRNFYRDYLKVDQPSLPIETPEQVHIQLSHPPHTGFGSADDSLASCVALRPKPPRKDLVKLMNNSEKVLRFEARMSNNLPEDASRKFIIGCFLADDSVAVWELRQRNSGHSEGKFAERSRKTNPATDQCFKPQDFFVGADVNINSVPFSIYRTDEYTLRYMEEHPEDFPMADPQQVAAKIAAVKSSLGTAATISPDDLVTASEAAGIKLDDQELITILRQCAEPGTSAISTEKLKQM